MEKFTKGEWLVHVNPQRDEIFIGMDSFNKDPYDYYTAHKVEISCVDEEAIANAHLIAAAPKMYEILKVLSGFNCPYDYMNQDEIEALSSIEGLLKEARGEHE